MWQGWATDPDFRRRGSSGGVLSALAHWLVSSGRANAVMGSGMSITNPTRTVPLQITTREDALASAGSRYAPVANSTPSCNCEAFIGKPCEVSGRFQLASHSVFSDHAQKPILLSFFCAGTPSQYATEDLARTLGIDPGDIASLRYRGNGWPGEFEVRAIDGRVRTMSYADSWGKNLGRRLQARCKLCPDGTGEHADIAVGDYWATDDQGFPVFANAEGNSVIIARTQLGAELLNSAAREGVITLNAVTLDDVAAVQPLQTLRRRTLAGRLVGRWLAGYRIPKYRGYRLSRRLVTDASANLKAAVGTFTRSTGMRK
ncbi:Coenzyme F420 hydrogenase/dehydrogenase, beta subunit C-terminal domain [Mycolicibacterium austroafricanum]|uniref:Coenzyme F420 hydrogenase/dehydrogenase, beta subunit C-terminal domain n=1 Tax=Mycolicibacterium austroafricanum TaxID=39687 RepID=UPI003B83336C